MFTDPFFTSLIPILGTIITAVWTLAWRISKQFDTMKTMVDTKMDQFLAKLERHQQQDDLRFSQINNNLWELRIQQALMNNGNISLDRKIKEENDQEEENNNNFIGTEVRTEKSRRVRSRRVHPTSSSKTSPG